MNIGERSWGELWFLLFQEQLALACERLPSSLMGVVKFVGQSGSGSEQNLGFLRLACGELDMLNDVATTDCLVVIDEDEIPSFFGAEDVPAGTFSVSGNSALFEGLLAAIEAAPQPMTLLEARSRR